MLLHVGAVIPCYMQCNPPHRTTSAYPALTEDTPPCHIRVVPRIVEGAGCRVQPKGMITTGRVATLRAKSEGSMNGACSPGSKCTDAFPSRPKREQRCEFRGTGRHPPLHSWASRLRRYPRRCRSFCSCPVGRRAAVSRLWPSAPRPPGDRRPSTLVPVLHSLLRSPSAALRRIQYRRSGSYSGRCSLSASVLRGTFLDGR